ncbi:hypothetical protein ACT91Q_01470 [Brevibacillus thermoruber]|uniref:hypothetical protein n=1 Tax=Brevibacillus thermoruber TaxID=33942 RepID=UPI00404224E8
MSEIKKSIRSGRKRKDDYYLIVVNDEESTLTKEDVLRKLESWYEDILLNNDYVSEYKKKTLRGQAD